MLYFLIILIILIIITVILFIKRNMLEELDSIIDTCSLKIEKTLKEKQELLNQIAKNTKNKKIIKLTKIDEYKDLFEKEKKLFDAKWNLNKLVNDKKYIPDNEYINVFEKLNDLEETLEGLKDYYNSKAITFNENYYKKPFYYIYKLLKIKQKKAFSIRKMEEFEILKD